MRLVRSAPDEVSVFDKRLDEIKQLVTTISEYEKTETNEKIPLDIKITNEYVLVINKLIAKITEENEQIREWEVKIGDKHTSTDIKQTRDLVQQAINNLNEIKDILERANNSIEYNKRKGYRGDIDLSRKAIERKIIQAYSNFNDNITPLLKKFKIIEEYEKKQLGKGQKNNAYAKIKQLVYMGFNPYAYPEIATLLVDNWDIFESIILLYKNASTERYFQPHFPLVWKALPKFHNLIFQDISHEEINNLRQQVVNQEKAENKPYKNPEYMTKYFIDDFKEFMQKKSLLREIEKKESVEALRDSLMLLGYIYFSHNSTINYYKFDPYINKIQEYIPSRDYLRQITIFIGKIYSAEKNYVLATFLNIFDSKNPEKIIKFLNVSAKYATNSPGNLFSFIDIIRHLLKKNLSDESIYKFIPLYIKFNSIFEDKYGKDYLKYLNTDNLLSFIKSEADLKTASIVLKNAKKPETVMLMPLILNEIMHNNLFNSISQTSPILLQLEDIFSPLNKNQIEFFYQNFQRTFATMLQQRIMYRNAEDTVLISLKISFELTKYASTQVSRDKDWSVKKVVEYFGNLLVQESKNKNNFQKILNKTVKLNEILINANLTNNETFQLNICKEIKSVADLDELQEIVEMEIKAFNSLKNKFDEPLSDFTSIIFLNVIPSLRNQGLIKSYSDIGSVGGSRLLENMKYFIGNKNAIKIVIEIITSLLIQDAKQENKYLRYFQLINGRLSQNSYSVSAFYQDLQTYDADIYKLINSLEGFIKIMDLSISILENFKDERIQVYPNPELIKFLYDNNKTIQEFLKMKDVTNSQIYKDATIYSKARLRVDYQYKGVSESYTYQEFKKMGQFDDPSPIIPKEFEFQRIWTSLELMRIENFVRLLRSKTNRKILLIGNLRLGRVYVDPLTVTCSDLSNLEISYAKIGSTQLHGAVIQTTNPFSRKIQGDLIKKKPIVIIVDNSERHKFPDAFKGYVNYFSALNWVLTKTAPKMLYDADIDRAGNRSQITEETLKADPSFMKTMKQIKRQAIFNLMKKSNQYNFKFVGHPFQDNISLRRLGGRGAERIFQKGMNDTDIKSTDYTTNLVSGNFFNKLDLDNENFVFFINAFFPFQEVYPKKTNVKLQGINKSLDELGVGDYVKSGQAGDFDDLDTVLLDQNRATNQTFYIDKKSKHVELANDDQINLLTEDYKKIRQQFINS